MHKAYCRSDTAYSIRITVIGTQKRVMLPTVPHKGVSSLPEVYTGPQRAQETYQPNQASDDVITSSTLSSYY
jgi:hypothetical protein